MGLVACLGCAGEQEPLIVENSLRLGADGECEIDIDNGDFIARGVYDVSGLTGYALVPILRNNLVASTTEGSNTGVEDGELRLEPNVDISVHMPSDVADRLPADVSRSYPINVATDSLGPGDRYAPQLSVLSRELVVALPGAILPAEPIEVAIDVQFHATRTGNSRGKTGVIDARLYTFPLTLCNGCLIGSCECDAADRCVPGTERHWLTCGFAQDPTFDEDDLEPFACIEPDPAESSTGPADGSTGPADSGSSG